jgi:RNA 3'-terminal phosphate cyclase (ATP)
LLLEYQAGIRAGFSAYGRKGLPAERVAEAACRELLAFHHSQAPVDFHLADQLLVPLAWARDESVFVTQDVTEHLTTNAWVIEQFGQAQVRVDSGSRTVWVRPVA